MRPLPVLRPAREPERQHVPVLRQRGPAFERPHNTSCRGAAITLSPLRGERSGVGAGDDGLLLVLSATGLMAGWTPGPFSRCTARFHRPRSMPHLKTPPATRTVAQRAKPTPLEMPGPPRVARTAPRCLPRTAVADRTAATRLTPKEGGAAASRLTHPIPMLLLSRGE
jgi:hypothetical protein